MTLSHIPPEVVQYFLTFLAPEALVGFTSTCTVFNRIYEDEKDMLWKKLTLSLCFEQNDNLELVLLDGLKANAVFRELAQIGIKQNPVFDKSMMFFGHSEGRKFAMAENGFCYYTGTKLGGNRAVRIQWPFDLLSESLVFSSCKQKIGRLNCARRSYKYFEVEIGPRLVDKTHPLMQDTLSIGYCTDKFTCAGTMPGWNRESFGWHSDDGLFFFNSGVGISAFSPDTPNVTFGTGDVVGCGIIHLGCVASTRRSLRRCLSAPSPRSCKHRIKIFFTKNGKIIPSSTEIDSILVGQTWSSQIYPCIGVDSREGFKPRLHDFLFDIDSINP